jgi:hypothetical protein
MPLPKREGAFRLNAPSGSTPTGNVMISFSSLATFMAGGTILESTSGTPPAVSAQRRFRFTVVAFVTFLTFALALTAHSWQKAFSLRVNKFIFNPADDGQENLERQRNGGGQI